MRNQLSSFALGFGFIFLASCAARRPPPTIQSLPILQEDGNLDQTSMDQLKQIRVGLRIGVEKASLTSEVRFHIKEADSTRTIDLPAGQIVVESKSGQIVIGDQKFGRKIFISPRLSSHYLTSNATKVRGHLIAVATKDSKVTIINELSLDAYLKGVLPREVIVSWPMEALKAQAVASRTYVVSHMGRHSQEGFDVCSDVHCQVYGGMSREHPQTSQAVDETRGEVLVFERKPITAYFSACCGGFTEQVGPVWGSTNKPYLPAKKCGYGKAAPWYHWSRVFANQDMLRLLKEKTEVKGSELKSFRVTKKSRSGRAEKVTIQTDVGSYTISGNSFRMALHPEKIRSTLWTDVRKQKNGYRFEGTGWGHGIGLCQWGAYGQAQMNWPYQKILQFYYPNTQLVLWKQP